ncbi:MAG: hypothetical protein AB7U59_13690 [Desulfovibrionaceae bacterium]
MSYTEGTASDQFDLLGKIKLFLEDNSWIINSYVTDTTTCDTNFPEKSTSAKRLHASKNNHYINFRSTQFAAITVNNMGGAGYGIGFNVSTGYDSSKKVLNQPGRPSVYDLGMELYSFCFVNGAVSYKMFLFDSPFTFLVYIKYSSTMFGQIYFAEIDTKYGSWDGGNIFLSSWDTSQTASSYSSLFGSFLSHNTYFSSVGSLGSTFKGAINITTTGAIPSGNTWPTRGVPRIGSALGSSTTASADNLFIPFMGWPESFGNSSSRSTSYLMNDLNSSLLQCLPAAFTSPLVLLPIQPALSGCSLLGEIPYMKITAGPTSLQEQIVTYAGKRYILLPLGTPATYSNGNYINPLLAVEYEGA